MRTCSIRVSLENVLVHVFECYGITEFATFLQMNATLKTHCSELYNRRER